MKFVRNAFGVLFELEAEADSEEAWRSNVPPTICLTLPSCRSIHGRNWDRRRLGSVLAFDIFLNVARWRLKISSDMRYPKQVSGK